MTNTISSLLWISIVIPNFKTHIIIMSARGYFMKRVKDCKDVSIMSLQDEQWRRTSLLCLYYCNFLVVLSTTVCSQNINKQTKFTAFSVGIPILNQRIIWKDDIELVTEFPCLLGHPVHLTHLTSQKTKGENWHVFRCEFWIQIKRKLRTYFNRYFIKIKSKRN